MGTTVASGSSAAPALGSDSRQCWMGGFDAASCACKGRARSRDRATRESIAFTQLPPQGRDMMTLIYQGGPFRYDKDGTVFGNRERILPIMYRGFYREYTVRTPGERSRGARRIICGGVKPAAPEACYYTDDHYASFRKIVGPMNR